MALFGGIRTGYLEGCEVDIPEGASRYVPDMFAADSYCMVKKITESELIQPGNVTFSTATHVYCQCTPLEFAFRNSAASPT